MPDQPDPTDLRARNRRAVENYLRTGLAERLERYRLYTEDGSAALAMTDVGHPIVVSGRDNLRRHGELSVQVLPDWRWRDVSIVECLDPNVIWVECAGSGTIRFPGYREGHYDNAFLIAFDLAEGSILRSREFSNPLEQMRALGIDVPGIARDWIPAEVPEATNAATNAAPDRVGAPA